MHPMRLKPEKISRRLPADFFNERKVIEMRLQEYLLAYFNVPHMMLMLLAAVIVVSISVAICIVAARLMSHGDRSDYGIANRKALAMSYVERFYELIFSGTFILLFAGVYFSIEYFGVGAQFDAFWDKYNGFILLLFILISVLLNTLIDNRIIPLNNLDKGLRATMRLNAMFYMLAIFAFIKFVYHDSNYDTIIMYFLTLAIGRFVYFDSSLETFQGEMKQMVVNLPFVALALLNSAVIAKVGFTIDYLLTANGVVMNLFIGHLYLLIVIFIIHRTRLTHVFA